MFKTRFYHKEEIIFRERAEGKDVYLVKSGKVQISKQVGDKKIVLAILEEGSIFGETSLLGKCKRTATATALDQTDLVIFDRSHFKDNLIKSKAFTQNIITSLIKRLAKTSSAVTACKSDDVFLSFCHLLELICREKAANENKTSWKQLYTKKKHITVRIQIANLIEQVEHILSISDEHIKSFLKNMGTFKIIEIEKEEGSEGIIVISEFSNFISKCKKVYDEWTDAFLLPFVQETDLISINELARVRNASEESLYKKLACGVMPDGLVLVRKKEFLYWLTEGAGKKARGPLRIEDMKEIEEVVFVDDKTIRDVVGGMDIYKICCVLKNKEESVKKKIYASLSKRVADVVRKEMKMISKVDEVEVREIEDEIINRIKYAKKIKNKENERCPV